MENFAHHPPLLSLKDLSIGAGSQTLLDNLSFTLNLGEIVAITGPSGLGKTTLLRCIGGLINPLRGQIKLRGRSPEELHYPKYRRHVVWVSQNPVMLDLSVRGNFLKPFEYHATTSSFDEARAKELLEEMGVGAERLDQNARTLSIGQQQRVALIRALLIKPDVLLLDEPTSALDITSVELVEKALRFAADTQGLGILAVTHNPEQAQRFCDRTLDLNEFAV